VRQTLEAAEQHGADFVVIDSPGKADSTAIVAAQFADLVLVPVEAHMSNLETLPGVYALLQATQNKTPPAFVLINKIHPSATTQAGKVKGMIAEIYPFPICPVHLNHLDVYDDSQAMRFVCSMGNPSRGSRLPHLAKNARYGPPSGSWVGQIPTSTALRVKKAMWVSRKRRAKPYKR